MGKIKAQLNRIALRVADADKAVEDLSALLGVSFYGPYDDEGVGLRVALPKSGGIEIMSPMQSVRIKSCKQKAKESAALQCVLMISRKQKLTLLHLV
mgnify:CR=1 FL=1